MMSKRTKAEGGLSDNDLMAPIQDTSGLAVKEHV